METEHLTKALLEQTDSLVKRILEKARALRLRSQTTRRQEHSLTPRLLLVCDAGRRQPGRGAALDAALHRPAAARERHRHAGAGPQPGGAGGQRAQGPRRRRRRVRAYAGVRSTRIAVKPELPGSVARPHSARLSGSCRVSTCCWRWPRTRALAAVRVKPPAAACAVPQIMDSNLALMRHGCRSAARPVACAQRARGGYHSCEGQEARH